MANQNSKNVKSEEEPSTSSEVLVADGSSSSKKIDVDDVTRALNDEYKKLKTEHLRVPCLWRGKWNEIAKKQHSSGAKAYLHPSKYHRALFLFTKSIAYAEDGSEELARAYCRRACTLYKLDGFKECSDDLDRALAANKCPSNLRVQAMKMKAKCLRFNEEARAKGVKIEKRFLGQIFKSIVMGEASAAAASSGEADDVETEWRNMCQFDNPRIPNASSKIRLGYDEAKCRSYVEVTEDLKAGEMIASQKCFSLFVENDLRYESCSYCMEMCQVLIPCQTCSEMMYCSIGCRDTAFESYHRLECKIMTKFLERGHKMHYSIRLLLIGTEQGAQLGNMIRRMSLPDLMTTKFPASQTFVDDYATVVRRPDETFSGHQLKEYAPFVAKMILILERAGFFDGDPSFLPDPEHPLLSADTLTRAQIFTAFLLLNYHVGIINDASGNGVRITWDGRRKTRKLGTCHCLLYSAFNHFPSPNVEFLFRNRELVAFATKPIKKGEELVILSCPSLEKSTCVQQVKELRMKYGFLCKCSRCRTKWPTDDDDKINFFNLQFYDHIKLEPTILIELKNLLAPSANSSKFITLPTKEIFGIIVGVCEWFFTNAKAPSHFHAGMQSLVSQFTWLMYDQFNSQLCSTERHHNVLHAHFLLSWLLVKAMANGPETAMLAVDKRTSNH